jgi:hypothetical protein
VFFVLKKRDSRELTITWIQVTALRGQASITVLLYSHSVLALRGSRRMIVRYKNSGRRNFISSRQPKRWDVILPVMTLSSPGSENPGSELVQICKTLVTGPTTIFFLRHFFSFYLNQSSMYALFSSSLL